MTGIPTQTVESILETPTYIESLYERVGGDKRLLCFSSPMAPFLDPGSMAYDDPERFGYKRLAHTLEEHRQLLLQPSWQHIMNYESTCLTKDEMVASTYEVGLRLNEIKGKLGIIEPAVATRTEQRIQQAKVAMSEIDSIMAGDPALRDSRLAELKDEVEQLNESTVCEKTELQWPASVNSRHIYHALLLWAKENLANLLRLRRPVQQPVGETSEA